MAGIYGALTMGSVILYCNPPEVSIAVAPFYR